MKCAAEYFDDIQDVKSQDIWPKHIVEQKSTRSSQELGDRYRSALIERSIRSATGLRPQRGRAENRRQRHQSDGRAQRSLASEKQSAPAAPRLPRPRQEKKAAAGGAICCRSAAAETRRQGDNEGAAREGGLGARSGPVRRRDSGTSDCDSPRCRGRRRSMNRSRYVPAANSQHCSTPPITS